MRVEFETPDGWLLERLTHMRYLGAPPYWRIEIIEIKHGRVVIGEAETINEALAAAEEKTR